MLTMWIVPKVPSLLGSEGCSEEQIEEIESWSGVKLPDDYRAFLKVAGVRAPRLWQGTDFEFRRLKTMQVEGRELLEAAGVELPSDAFVFYMHQGYVLFFVSPGGVFHYEEDDEGYSKRAKSFAEFFEMSSRAFG